MFKIIGNQFRNLKKFYLLTKRSDYNFYDKIVVFKILLSNYIKSKFYNENKEVTQKIFDFEVTSYGHNSLLYLFEEIFLSNEYYFEASNQSPLIFDCGANIGMAVLFFKRKYPECSIMAFEPNPDTFKLLQKNVNQNNLTNVQIFNVGLASFEGTIDFFIDQNKGTLIGSIKQSRGGDNKITVKTEKLSSFIDNSIVDLVKIDIEGAEEMVIKELIIEEKISLCKRFIIEYHHRVGKEKSNLSVFLKQFEENNFEYNLRTKYSSLGGFQDILIDFYKDENIEETSLVLAQ